MVYAGLVRIVRMKYTENCFLCCDARPGLTEYYGTPGTGHTDFKDD